MASPPLPDCRARRKLLAEDSPRLAAAGQALLAAGRLGEALECLAAAGDAAGLERLRLLAVTTGDLWLWRQAGGSPVAPAAAGELGQLAMRAQETGKAAFAAAARALFADSGTNR